MINENIDKTRRDAISEIREKAKKNPGYLHPCNKERREDMKTLEFDNGYEFTRWMQQNGIMNSITNVNLRSMRNLLKNAECKTQVEYKNKNAQKLGFENFAEQVKIECWNNGIHEPLELNEDCSPWFGQFTENLMIHIYPGAKKMPYGNPGFDYLWNGVKIDNKGRCLEHSWKSQRWKFDIRWNNSAEKFSLSGWDNRKSLVPIVAFEFDRNDIVRGKPFWKRDSISITYTPEGLEQFEDYQIDIEWLKKLCDKQKEWINDKI